MPLVNALAMVELPARWPNQSGDRIVESMRERKCPCGHSRGHPAVAQDAEYTLWGWIQLSMLGITPLPDRIVFRCRRCSKSLGVTRDPALLRKRMMPDQPTAPAPANPAPRDDEAEEKPAP